MTFRIIISIIAFVIIGFISKNLTQRSDVKLIGYGLYTIDFILLISLIHLILQVLSTNPIVKIIINIFHFIGL